MNTGDIFSTPVYDTFYKVSSKYETKWSPNFHVAMMWDTEPALLFGYDPFILAHFLWVCRHFQIGTIFESRRCMSCKMIFGVATTLILLEASISAQYSMFFCLIYVYLFQPVKKITYAPNLIFLGMRSKWHWQLNN